METFTISVSIGHRLKVLMAEVGCKSIQELAHGTTISANTLYNLDRGVSTNLTLENVCKLLWFFDCSFEELFQYQVKTNEPGSFEELSDDVQEALQAGRKEYQSFKNQPGQPIKSHPNIKPFKHFKTTKKEA